MLGRRRCHNSKRRLGTSNMVRTRRTLVHLFIGQLPAWARRDHPVLRQELGSATAKVSWQRRYGLALGAVVGGGVLLLIGYLIATNLLQRPAGQTPVEIVNA